MNYLEQPLVEQPLAGFLESVASDEPAPGGGSVVAEIAAQLAGEGNPNLRGDAVAAALLAEAGVRAAAVLVRINTAAEGVSDDRPGRADELATKAAEAARRAVGGEG